MRLRRSNKGPVVVIGLVIAGVLALGMLLTVDADGFFGTYSEGYRMGQLDKASVKGLIDSCEGQLLLGRESTPYTKVSGSGDSETETRVNPWYFSGGDENCGDIQQFGGKYVWIRYNQARMMNPFTRDTDYTWKEVQLVTKKAPERTSYAIDQPSGWKSDGFRIGRIVKASHKGQVFGTWEVMLQVGNAGANFKNMSITDEGMYKYALEVLKSGMPVKISYNQSYVRNPAARDTTYDIWKIEVATKDAAEAATDTL